MYPATMGDIIGWRKTDKDRQIDRETNRQKYKETERFIYSLKYKGTGLRYFAKVWNSNNQVMTFYVLQ